MLASLACVALVGFVLVSGATDAPVTCDPSINNGIVEIGCWGYRHCVNGHVVTVTCPDGYVFERETSQCVLLSQAHNDCRSTVDCTNKADGSYPDKTHHCITFYRCYNGQFYGHFYCPSGTLFDEAAGLCNFASQVIC